MHEMHWIDVSLEDYEEDALVSNGCESPRLFLCVLSPYIFGYPTLVAKKWTDEARAVGQDIIENFKDGKMADGMPYFVSTNERTRSPSDPKDCYEEEDGIVYFDTMTPSFSIEMLEHGEPC